MDLVERRRTLVEQLQQLGAGIAQAAAQQRRIEGAIALLDEQLAEVAAVRVATDNELAPTEETRWEAQSTL